jgi:hypothetical protein
VSPLARRVAKLEQHRAAVEFDPNRALDVGRACLLEGRPLPTGLSDGERQIALALVDQLERFRADPRPLPLEPLPS